MKAVIQIFFYPFKNLWFTNNLSSVVVNILKYLLVIFFAAVQCPQPLDVENGRVVSSSSTYGSLASYECINGYRLVGPATRKCEADKQWEGEQPFCEGKLLFICKHNLVTQYKVTVRTLIVTIIQHEMLWICDRWVVSLWLSSERVMTLMCSYRNSYFVTSHKVISHRIKLACALR